MAGLNAALYGMPLGGSACGVFGRMARPTLRAPVWRTQLQSPR